ncbi:MAG TPA: hypothetical protein VFD39_10220 [Trueperaceae bacterium]|nr:hypothetical protein [Trueperaceae bacterium]
MERFELVPTPVLEQEVSLLQIRIIHGTATDLEVERYCLIQLELGGRALTETVNEPRD